MDLGRVWVVSAGLGARVVALEVVVVLGTWAVVLGTGEASSGTSKTCWVVVGIVNKCWLVLFCVTGEVRETVKGCVAK